jgi:quercetin dioxygenase-like cupin family protein
MGESRIRRGEEVAWEENKHGLINGKQQWQIRNKFYFDPKKTPALLRLVEYAPGYTEKAHSHTAAEVIYVVDGELRVPGATFKSGDALLIDADTVYGPLEAGPQGLKFLLVRFAPAEMVMAQ